MEFDLLQLSEPFTPTQREAIPLAFKGYDILEQAATGTGKTAAFGIPIIEKIKKEEGLKVLILTPPEDSRALWGIKKLRESQKA